MAYKGRSAELTANREHYRVHTPDRAWISKQWTRLTAAETWDKFTWYPATAG